MELNQYEIVLVNLDPTIGSEMKKTRPCVIVSPNEMNKFLRTIVVAPMTTKSKKYPTRIEIKHDNKMDWIVIDQIRTINKKAKDIASDKIFYIDGLASVKQAIKLMKEHNVPRLMYNYNLRVAPVEEKGAYIGMIDYPNYCLMN